MSCRRRGLETLADPQALETRLARLANLAEHCRCALTFSVCPRSLLWPPLRKRVTDQCRFFCGQGPFTEECLFRSAAVPLLLLAGSDSTNIILRSPLVFGLAHLHHFYEFRITHPQTPLIAAAARSIFQFLYTYIFGVYATFILMRTGSLLAAISAHALCNSIGLPRLWGSVEPYWLFRHDPSGPPSPAIWTALYYILLVAGFALWHSNLYILTESPMALAVF